MKQTEKMPKSPVLKTSGLGILAMEKRKKWALFWRITFCWVFSIHLACSAPPDIMLLKTYNADKVDFMQGQWVWSEKYDGVRAYWDGKHLISRGGHPIYAPTWFLQVLPPFAIDGELWMGRQQFQQTVSTVRQKKPDPRWHQIQYLIFEVPNASGGLLQRLAKLNNYLKRSPVSFLKIIAQHPIKTKENIDKILQQVTKVGGEGIVIRDASKPYQTGRLSSALKVKPVYDAECVVSGYLPGKGKNRGKVGALKCLLANHTEIHIGSGLTQKQREKPPEIGTIVTYQYYGKTKKGLPRHPVFKRVRTDATLNTP